MTRDKLIRWCPRCYRLARWTGEPTSRAILLAVDHRWHRGYRPVGRWRSTRRGMYRGRLDWGLMLDASEASFHQMIDDLFPAAGER